MNLIRNYAVRISGVSRVREFHSSAVLSRDGVPIRWLTYNDKMYPPQAPDEPRRPAFVCHMKTNFKYSKYKLWYIAAFVRGMAIDEALRQLQFINKKGAALVADTIREARELAINEHNVEFGSNLWVAESFVGKGRILRGIRRHAKGKIGKIDYVYTHYFLRLEEGKPPKDYYWPEKTPQELLSDWVDGMRKRKVISSL